MQKDTPDTIKNQIRRIKKKLHSPKVEGELVYLLSSRLKEKDAHSIFYKSTTDKKSFLNKESKYVVTRRLKNH